MTPYHDRMPVLLAAEDFSGWLSGSLDVAALKPAAESALREWVVSARVNRAGVVQGGLFDLPDDARSQARMRALDCLNARYGRGTIAVGTAASRQGWKLRSEFHSPRFTTDWEELLRV